MEHSSKKWNKQAVEDATLWTKAVNIAALTASFIFLVTLAGALGNRHFLWFIFLYGPTNGHPGPIRSEPVDTAFGARFSITVGAGQNRNRENHRLQNRRCSAAGCPRIGRDAPNGHRIVSTRIALRFLFVVSDGFCDQIDLCLFAWIFCHFPRNEDHQERTHLPSPTFGYRACRRGHRRCVDLPDRIVSRWNLTKKPAPAICDHPITILSGLPVVKGVRLWI